MLELASRATQGLEQPVNILGQKSLIMSTRDFEFCWVLRPKIPCGYSAILIKSLTECVSFGPISVIGFGDPMFCTTLVYYC